MSAVLAPPLIAAGPPGWLVLGVLTVLTAGVAILAMENAADEAAEDKGTGDAEECPHAETGAKPVVKPREYPANPDDLLEEGYEDVTHPDKRKNTKDRTFTNPETGDTVEFHPGKPGKPGWQGKDHYHRFNPRGSGRNKDLYVDKSGRPAPRNSDESHLEPKK